MPTQSFLGPNSTVDSNDVNGGQPLPIASTNSWTRALTVSTYALPGEMRFEVYVSGGVAKVRLTRVSFPGLQHGLLQTDLTQVNKYVPLTTVNGTGTVNQLNAGDILSANVNTLAGAEIGFEFEAVSGSPTVRVVGSIQKGS